MKCSFTLGLGLWFMCKQWKWILGCGVVEKAQTYEILVFWTLEHLQDY